MCKFTNYTIMTGLVHLKSRFRQHTFLAVSDVHIMIDLFRVKESRKFASDFVLYEKHEQLFTVYFMSNEVT